ncbi:MAG: hypothetical protein QM809_14620 [Gordonia sp. (in: high G+C Gram-positive bacteria)]|uniref:hypothetical protein n=1 Tax=Gordonia sp. (in: high G+C Gram-positive bacteria) TaxID=84139 RepID=UPI0039E669DB
MTQLRTTVMGHGFSKRRIDAEQKAGHAGHDRDMKTAWDAIEGGPYRVVGEGGSLPRC